MREQRTQFQMACPECKTQITLWDSAAQKEQPAMMSAVCAQCGTRTTLSHDGHEYRVKVQRVSQVAA